MRNDICDLMTSVADGTEIKSYSHPVFCAVKSVVRSEFYAAYAVGLSPKITFEIDPDDYSKCIHAQNGSRSYPTQIRHDGEIYIIIRTYKKSIHEMEITAG